MSLRSLMSLPADSLGQEQTDFLRRAVPEVLRFCTLFVGNPRLADEAAVRAFVRLRTEPNAVQHGTPIHLLSSALDECKRTPALPPDDLAPLQSAILGLDEQQRAVFILHAVLSIPLPWVCAIVGVSNDEALQVYAKALIEIRNFLSPTDYLKERSR